MAGLRGPRGLLSAGKHTTLLSTSNGGAVVTITGGNSDSASLAYTPGLDLTDPRNVALFFAMT